jgi:cell surface protein SprA
VLIPSFLSAYGTYSKNNAPLERFPMIPFPNWQVNITSLSKIDFIKNVAKSINISHSYKSTYSVGSFLSNQDFGDPNDLGNIIPKNEIASVSINEQFNPLINLDITWKNNLTSRFQISKSRRVSLSFANSQITETLSEQYSFSLGYRFEDFNLIVNFGQEEEALKNDLNIKGNLKIRDNLTVLRKLDEEVDHQATAGQKNVVIGASADYALSNRFNVRVFYDRNVNEPKISRSFPTSNTNFGFSLRFTLSE